MHNRKWAIRKVLAAFPAIKLIVQLLQRSKQLLPQTEYFHYLLNHAYTGLIKASESVMTSNGYVRYSQNLQNPLCCWSRAPWLKWRVSKGHSNLLSEITSPNLFGRCANTKWFHNLWRDCSWMLALCPYWTHQLCKFSISEFNSSDFEMCQFGSCS